MCIVLLFIPFASGTIYLYAQSVHPFLYEKLGFSLIAYINLGWLVVMDFFNYYKSSLSLSLSLSLKRSTESYFKFQNIPFVGDQRSAVTGFLWAFSLRMIPLGS
jgi:hypothetical protein